MKQRKKSKYVHEGQYVAEVEVALLEDTPAGLLISVLKMPINWTT